MAEGAHCWSATQYFSISYQVLQNLVALLSLMKWNNIELECSKLQRWLAQTTVFFKLSLDCKDIIECSMKINFKYARIVMSTIHVESLKHCWVDRGDDELQCIM